MNEAARATRAMSVKARLGAAERSVRRLRLWVAVLGAALVLVFLGSLLAPVRLALELAAAVAVILAGVLLFLGGVMGLLNRFAGGAARED